MAEGWARHLKSDVLEFYSAGVNPVEIDPLAVKVMADEGVDISSNSHNTLTNSKVRIWMLF